MFTTVNYKYTGSIGKGMETQQSKAGSVPVAVRLSTADVAMLDALVREGKYLNRSDAVRGLIRR